MGGIRENLKKLFFLSVVISLVLVFLAGLDNAIIPIGCSICYYTCPPQSCQCGPGCSKVANPECASGYSCGTYNPIFFYKSAPNQCGFYDGFSSSCGAPNNFCNAGQYYPATGGCFADELSSCLLETASASCDVCGNCTGGSDTCSAVACGTKNNYGCANVCDGGIGAGHCKTIGSTGDVCSCAGMCASNICTGGVCIGKSSTMTSSANPAYPPQQPLGTTVTFTCSYKDAATGAAITTGEVNVVIGAAVNPATWNATTSTYQYSQTFATATSFNWYCNGTDLTGGYNSASSSSQSYQIGVAYCNVAWASTPDFKVTPDEHYAAVINGNVQVAVSLTNSSGGPVSRSVNITSPWGMYTVTSDATTGIATLTLPLPLAIGKYTPLNVTAPPCPAGIATQNNIDSYINVFHDSPSKIVVTDPPPPSSPGVNRSILQEFTISLEVRDQFDNICDSSYDGQPYSAAGFTGPDGNTWYHHIIGIQQNIYNTTPAMELNYAPPDCTAASTGVDSGTTPCFWVPSGSDEGKHTFTLVAYPWPFDPTTGETHSWSFINNIIQEYDANLSGTYSNMVFTQNGIIGPTVRMNYSLPPTPKATQLIITFNSSSIKVGYPFQINVTAVFPNGMVDTGFAGSVTIRREPRPEIGMLYTDFAVNIPFVNGVATFDVSSTLSNLTFNVSGIYTITALVDANNSMNTSAALAVGSSGLNHIDVVTTPPAVFWSMPFDISAAVKDSSNNVVIDYIGQINITCPNFLTFPVNMSRNLTLDDRGVAHFYAIIANSTGLVSCNVSTFDPVKGFYQKTFTILMLQPAACVNYTIPPTSIINPPIDVVNSTADFPPVYDVNKQNLNVGNSLIGYDPATGKIKGNFSICLETYYTGRMCFNNTDIQFDKAPVAVCVKEFVYNPQADGSISDHLNYNGTGTLEETFKHPEIVWGWGFKNYSGTVSSCGIATPSTRYDVTLTPDGFYTDYFNVTITLPLTVLEPYNITNISVLNPHELYSPEALLVADHRDSGRVAKFTADGSQFLEEYTDTTSILNSNPQAMAYDNRGNIYLAATDNYKVIVLRMVRSNTPTIHFIRDFQTITANGTLFKPYSLDTDSWGNLYVLGNTNPDKANNHICINKYDKDGKLNDSNNCCGNESGNCEQEHWEGTATGITSQEDGGAIYVVRGKKRECTNCVSGLGCATCFWTGNPYIYQYNGSNVSQNISMISILGSTLPGIGGPEDIATNNPTSSNGKTGPLVLDPGCNNWGDTSTIIGNANETDPEAHFLRGIKYRKGYLFVLDYLDYPYRTNYHGCQNTLWYSPYSGCMGCCFPTCFQIPLLLTTVTVGCNYNASPTPPYGCIQNANPVPDSGINAAYTKCLNCPNPDDCNNCGPRDTYQNQMVRVLVMDTINGPSSFYRARVTIEPNETVSLWSSYKDTLGWGQQIYGNQGWQYVQGKSSETHSLDVDQDLNVYVALKGKRNAVVEYKFQPTVQDPGWKWTSTSSPGVPSASFQLVAGWDPSANKWTNLTDNVTLPDALLAWPDIIKQSMMAGVSCEGCSQEGAVEPSVCKSQISETNSSNYQNISTALNAGTMSAGSPLVLLNSSMTPVYRRNFISTNITAFLRFNYTISISPVPNGVGCGGASNAPSGTTVLNKMLNITSYSNNLNVLVEGGSSYFQLTRPYYITKPTVPPNTLPYLAYNYLGNRFYYKHFPMMDNITSLMGPTQYSEWLLNGSSRKSFQVMENQYYSYQYLSTVPILDAFGVQAPTYSIAGSWQLVGGNWVWVGDNDAASFLNYAVTDTATSPSGAISLQGTIPLNNTMNWSYPITLSFTPVALEKNPLPFTPQDPIPGGDTNYNFTAITNVSILQLSIRCNDSSGNSVTYTKTISNTSYILLGRCITIRAISIAGAWQEASVFILPQGLSSDNGLCFESLSGPNASMCGTTKAWFRESIMPNTVVVKTDTESEIEMPTRYPMLGGAAFPPPSSLVLVPVKVGGPTLITVVGGNETPDTAQQGRYSRIEGTANMMGTQLPNPLPIRGLDSQSIYFSSPNNVSFIMRVFNPSGSPSFFQDDTIDYTVNTGWKLIAGLGTPYDGANGSFYEIHNVQCNNGCLLMFSNDSAGANIVGELFMWKGWAAYGIPVEYVTIPNGQDKVPAYTFVAPAGQVQVVPDDPMNRNYAFIYQLSGTGNVGDEFRVYTDPELTLNIDNITAVNCAQCTADADCVSGQVCRGGICTTTCTTDSECQSRSCVAGACNQTCGLAVHPSGPPCTESFVCPRIELSSLNDSISVASTMHHDTNNDTVITVVGTDDTPQYTLINDSVTLGAGTDYWPGDTVSFNTNKRFSSIYIIKVTNGIKGESLTFYSGGNEVARIYIPSENYTAKSSIATILPQPRRLRITSNRSIAGGTVSYTIKGTREDNVLVEESGVGTLNPASTCSLTGPSTVTPDSSLNQCQFQFDNILNQQVSVPFNIRIRAVPTSWSPHDVPNSGYLSLSDSVESANLCTAAPATAMLGAPDSPPDTNSVCMGTAPVVIVPHWQEQSVVYVADVSDIEHNRGLNSGTVADLVGAPDSKSGAAPATASSGTPDEIIAYFPNGMNESALHINAYPRDAATGGQCAQACSGSGCTLPDHLQIYMSSNPSCFSHSSNTAVVESDFSGLTYFGAISFTNPTDLAWNDYTLEDGTVHQIYCIGIATEVHGYGLPAGSCHQWYYINAIGAMNNTYVSAPSPLSYPADNAEAVSSCTPPPNPPPSTLLGPPDAKSGYCLNFNNVNNGYSTSNKDKIVVHLPTPIASSDISGINLSLMVPAGMSFGGAPMLNIFVSNDSSCYTGNAVNDFNRMTYGWSWGGIPVPNDGQWYDVVYPNSNVFMPSDYQVRCIGVTTWNGLGNSKIYVRSIGVVSKLGMPTTSSFIAAKFTSPMNITGLDLVAKNLDPTGVNPLQVQLSDDPSCLTGSIATDSDPAHWTWSVPVSLQPTGSFNHNTVTGIGPYQNVWCLGFNQTQPAVRWDFDAIDVYYTVPAVQPVYNCSQFNGNVTLGDSAGMCPTSAGPFVSGVWSGEVMVPNAFIGDFISASNGAVGGSSNHFDVSSAGGVPLSFDTQGNFTHVLAIKIQGLDNEHFNVTTVPLYVDGLSPTSKSEQIGTIKVVPNDFVLGFHQNESGTHIFSQQDSVILNIPDNKSLGLHDFQFRFFDRFNNTFIEPYTIFLRQPTAFITTIQTVRASNINLTTVYVTAKLLYQRYDKPDEQPNRPIGPGFMVELYVQNSSQDPHYGDIPVAISPPQNPVGCDPISACPYPPEDSNCSCPDWIDDPIHGGECIPNPVCHQYGILSNTSGGVEYFTNESGEINASFNIYGFGRRLFFVVFNGTDEYAPAIDIQPFYAGGVSIGLGSFDIAEPLLLLLLSLFFLAVKRKFNKQKKD